MLKNSNALFIKSSESFKEDVDILKLVDQVFQKCQICMRHKRVSPRSIVGLPLASDFNHIVAMDLTTYEPNVWVPNLTDKFSRYSVTCVCRSKPQEVITDALLKTLISYNGQRTRFLADNGGEFLYETYKEMSKTAAESLWLNGLCERHTEVIKESVEEVIEETRCTITWTWTNGYSPNQIVFGKNLISVQTVLNDKLPALQGVVSSSTVANNLNAMHKAWEIFMKSGSSEKICQALNHNVRSCNDAQFFNGQKMFYKGNDNNRWHEPGTVIGQEHKQILVEHGST